MKEKKKSSFGSYVQKFATVCLLTTLMGSALAGCSKGGDSGTGTEKRVLRIGFMYSSPDNEQWVRQQFTDSYELLHPELDIQIVGAVNYDDMRFEERDPNKPYTEPDTYGKLKELLDGPNPVDVVVLDNGYNSTSYLKRLVQDNMLKQLDTYIQDKEFDIDDYVPAVIDGIKEAGDNAIYALTPTFNSSALFYNPKVFTDAGVEPPTDNMMWDDVINKAKVVAKGEKTKRIFGLQFNRWGGDPFWDMQQSYLPALQLKMYDDKGEKMSVSTPQWEKVFTTMASLYKDKIVPSGEDMYADQKPDANGNMPFNPFSGDLFINGRVAMTVGRYEYITELERAKEQHAKNDKVPSVDWQVVTMPQHSENPGFGSDVTLSNLMGISAKASNPEDAWDFIAFNNSKEWAKLKSRSTYDLIARKSMLKPRNGADYNIAAFYTLKPISPISVEMEKLQREKPGINNLPSLGQQAFQQVMENKKSAADALKEWETKGNAFLQKLKDNPNAWIEETEGGVPGRVY
ncbi:ABC transporter substrate-binding protein [Paenibacillus sp. GCM10027626]|uniref:ABC transporter substrate-binding protein n=1 Tax=Paenibacillus sp. GCM10027626 TaxID=3273411 RepID=UPI0036450E6A